MTSVAGGMRCEVRRDGRSADADRAQEIAEADLVILGPAPPLRGGIAQHTHRLGEAVLAAGLRVAAVSFRRLYPASFFPGRSQRTDVRAPEWSREELDVLSPPSWMEVARLLAPSRATVVLQWWHPVIAPAVAVAARHVPRERLAAVCHNVTPHEPVAGAALAARVVLSRCSRVVCHSMAEAARVEELLGPGATEVASVPMPGLLGERALRTPRAMPELAALPPAARLAVAAGHLRPYKDVALLLEAWTCARLPNDARLVVAGESYLSGAAARQVRAMAERDSSIVLVDRYVNDEELVHLLRSAEVLVAAHRRASQSGVVPLARTLGTPCLVSDAGGLPEQASGGDPAEVVPAGDMDALRVALERRFARAAASHRDMPCAASDRASDWRRVLAAVRGTGTDGGVEAFPGAARPTARPGAFPQDDDSRRASR